MSPVVSVIMPVRNGGVWLIEAVQSILSQQGVSIELIVINDGSEDGSADYLRSLSDARLHILDSGGAGLVSALNIGINAARGQYIARMDADDIMLSGRLARQSEVLDAAPEVGMVHSAAQIIDAAGNSTHIIGAENMASDGRLAILLGEKRGAPIVHPSVMMRASVLRAVDGYRNIPAAEDHDLWLRLIKRCDFYAINEPLIRYRQHECSLSRRKAAIQMLSNLMNSAGYIIRLRFGIDIFADRSDVYEAVRSNAVAEYGERLNMIAHVRSIRWKLRREPSATNLLKVTYAGIKTPRLLFDQYYVANEVLAIRDHIIASLSAELLSKTSHK